MKSATPKPLHDVCGKPAVGWAVEAAKAAGADAVMVVTSCDEVDAAVRAMGALTCAQDTGKGKGTGCAVISAGEWITSLGGPLLVLTCDQPLTRAETLMDLASRVEAGAACAMASAELDDPSGCGRIIRERESRSFVRITEERDLAPEQKAIHEVNISLYCFDAAKLYSRLSRMTTDNSQKEYYITDMMGILLADGERVDVLALGPTDEGLGFNDRAQLALVTDSMRRKINNAHMLGGVTIIDPSATYISADVTIGCDTVIYPGVVLERATVIGQGVRLLPNSRISASEIKDGATVESSVVVEAVVGRNTTVGPFAYLRPHSVIGDNCRVGDFVEVKNAAIGNHSKISHLSYVGDAEVGERVNFSCGAITSNYDGKHKSRTVIEDDAFIGCNTNLVAPVRVGKHGYTAAGSTVTEDVGEGDLAIARARQINKPGWVAKRKADGKL